MSLANEAAYLYVLSKEFTSLNKGIKKVSEKAQQHLERYRQAKTPEEQQKRQREHAKQVEKIRRLMEKHNELLAKLRHHQIAFAHQLQKEHQIK